jgi:ELP3 family radical SAM enzyme/protein acetyltransferase
MRDEKLILKNAVVLYVYRTMIKNNSSKSNSILLNCLQKNPSRNISGVAVLTVVMSPYPNGQSFSCKHDCFYCPKEPDQPRSYLKKEPAVARANQYNFDANGQVFSRLSTLDMNGHTLDKVEIILEGGTFTEYPINYSEEYIRDIIYTVNTYHDRFKREKYSIKNEILINATAEIKIVGISCETRPDCIEEEPYKWLSLFRKWGITRVQLGVQHINDIILKKINRGHKLINAINGIKILKQNGFKVIIHIMPDLPGSDFAQDIKMFNYIYNSESLQPDEMKVYPCQVVPWTTIEKWNKLGKYIPYADSDFDKFCEVIEYAISECPPHIRLPRVVRDIPNDYISAGNKVTNLRQIIEDSMAKKLTESKDIRHRESGRFDTEGITPKFCLREYKASDGIEYFLSYESEDNRILFGFLRLRLNKSNKYIMFDELRNSALIRELHVYGKVVSVGNNNKNGSSQHLGYGSKLLRKAEKIAANAHYHKISVINGIGVSNYYKKRGYYVDGLYMTKNIVHQSDYVIYISYLSLFILVLNIIGYFVYSENMNFK